MPVVSFLTTLGTTCVRSVKVRVSALTRVATEASAGTGSIRDYHWPVFGISLFDGSPGAPPLSFIAIDSGEDLNKSQVCLWSHPLQHSPHRGSVASACPSVPCARIHIVLGLALVSVRLVCLLVVIGAAPPTHQCPLPPQKQGG